MVRTRAAAISLETFRRNSRTAVIKCKGIKFAAADICARLHALPCHAGCTAAAVANLAAARRAHAAAITAAKAAFVEALPSLVKLMQDTELASNAAGIHRLVSMCHAVRRPLLPELGLGAGLQRQGAGWSGSCQRV